MLPLVDTVVAICMETAEDLFDLLVEADATNVQLVAAKRHRTPTAL